MISEEFMQILRQAGEVKIKYLPPIEESYLGSWDESVIFEVDTPLGPVGSGAYVCDGLDVEFEDETLDRLAARLVEGVQVRKEMERRRLETAKKEEEEWDVEGSWLSDRP